VARHGSGDDEAASLPLSEMKTNGPGTVEDTIQIRVDDFFPVSDRAIENTTVGGSAGVGDEDINLAKVLDDVGNKLFDLGVLANVAFVGFRSDAVLLPQLLGVALSSLTTRGVSDCDVSSHFRASSGSFCANSRGSRSSGDHDDLALEAKEVFQVCSFWHRDGGRHRV